MALPMFFEQDCDICKSRRVEINGRLVPTCADCGVRIPNYDFPTIPGDEQDRRYRNMGGHGAQSFTWDHEHLVSLEGGPMGRGPGYRELCWDCKDIDFRKRYPKP